MKKRLVASLAAAMVLGVAGSAFAAANPFVDVPANNWAYDSVKSLAKAGIVDGYADGKFMGDKTITRYEMAQIVAKAMAKEDKVDAAQKATIDKLAVEFADELNKIGVRLTALETNQPTVKFSGQLDTRYSSKNYSVEQARADVGAIRLRLNASAKVDDNTIVGFRFVNVNPNQTAANTFGLAENNTWSKFGNDNTNQSTTASVDRFFIQSKLGGVDTTLGRQALVVGTTAAIVDSGAFSFDGVKFATKMGQVNVVLNYGRLPGGTTASTTLASGTLPSTQNDIGSIELSSQNGKFSYGGGVFEIGNDVTGNLPAALTAMGVTRNTLKLEFVNGKYAFDDKFSLKYEAGQNKASYATANNKFYTVIATYGDQVLAKAGDNNIAFTYNYAGVRALALDISNGMGLNTFGEPVGFGTSLGIEQYNLAYSYAFSKNLSSQLIYYNGMSDDTTKAYKLYRAVVTAKF
jgi:hypothetical protein